MGLTKPEEPAKHEEGQTKNVGRLTQAFEAIVETQTSAPERAATNHLRPQRPQSTTIPPRPTTAKLIKSESNPRIGVRPQNTSASSTISTTAHTRERTSTSTSANASGARFKESASEITVREAPLMMGDQTQNTIHSHVQIQRYSGAMSEELKQSLNRRSQRLQSAEAAPMSTLPVPAPALTPLPLTTPTPTHTAFQATPPPPPGPPPEADEIIDQSEAASEPGFFKRVWTSVSGLLEYSEEYEVDEDTCPFVGKVKSLESRVRELNNQVSQGNERYQNECEQRVLLLRANNILLATSYQLTFCDVRWGQMVIVELEGLDLLHLKPLGSGCNGIVILVRVKPSTHDVETNEVALKMIFNYAPGTSTANLKALYDSEHTFGRAHPHWCFAIIFNAFRAPTRISLFPEEERSRYTIITDQVVRGGCCGNPDVIPLLDRTLYLTMEPGQGNVKDIVRDKFSGGRSASSNPLQRENETVHGIRTLAFCCLCACDHMNSLGWFHNDIKLDNILRIQRTKTTRISHAMIGDIWAFCDLGTSRYCPSGYLVCNNGEGFSGNIQNRAPEVFLPTIQGQSLHYPISKNDVWAVGCVLYEVITGRPPLHVENQFLLIPNKFIDVTPISALVPYLLEENPTIRPTAKQALLISGALMFLPPPHNTNLFSLDPSHIAASMNFYGQGTKVIPEVESILHQVLESNLRSLDPTSTHSSSPSRPLQQTQTVVPTVEQVCSLVFTKEALSDVAGFCSVLHAFCSRRAVYYKTVTTRTS